MDHIGSKVKQLRIDKGMTLKELSTLTNLSTGFLSQFERDQGTIAIESLQVISDVFDVSISHFITPKKNTSSPVLRSYAQHDYQVINSQYISSILVNDPEQAAFLPRIVEILPSKSDNEDVELQTHKGVEFIYVLEGILDLYVDHELHSMYPGDAAYFESTKEHNWINNTNKTVKLLTVNSPNSFISE